MTPTPLIDMFFSRVIIIVSSLVFFPAGLFLSCYYKVLSVNHIIILGLILGVLLLLNVDLLGENLLVTFFVLNLNFFIFIFLYLMLDNEALNVFQKIPIVILNLVFPVVLLVFLPINIKLIADSEITIISGSSLILSLMYVLFSEYILSERIKK